MRNIVVLGLFGMLGLVGCAKFEIGGVKPNAQTVDLLVEKAVIDRCGEVIWQDTALSWTDNNTLKGNIGISVWDGQTRQDAKLDNRSVRLAKAGTYTLSNRTGATLGTLNSTFTCVKTGEHVGATLTFPQTQDYLQEWATGSLKLVDGQLKAIWLQASPPT